MIKYKDHASTFTTITKAITCVAFWYFIILLKYQYSKFPRLSMILIYSFSVPHMPLALKHSICIPSKKEGLRAGEQPQACT